MREELTKNEERWLILRARMIEENVVAAFEHLRAHGIEPVLIKGWAAARWYPQKYRRIFADIDLAVAPELFEKTVGLLNDEKSRSLNIDLHRGLRHLDTAPWPDLYKNSRLVRLDRTDVRILSPEDHLRVLCVHWLNDGGSDKDKLLDIYYAVKNRPEDFSWERCLGAVAPNRRDWIFITIGLTRKYFDLDVSDLPFAAKTERLPAWIVQTIENEWTSGVRLKPIWTVSGSRSEFWQQIKKRFPPNPLQSTVEMDGVFDGRSRHYYQFVSFSKRLRTSFLNLLKLWRRRF
jgi:hypothetical protein